MGEERNLDFLCPRCGASLLDKKTLLTGLPSIKLAQKTEGNFSFIWLSAVLGNLKNKVENEIAEGLYCPYCHFDLSTPLECDFCSSALFFLKIKGGGKITLCTRRGCPKHTLSFVSLPRIREEAISSESPKSAFTLPKTALAMPELTKNRLSEFILNSFVLPLYCPFCGRCLIADDRLHLQVEYGDGQKEILKLYPYLTACCKNLPAGKTIKNVKCPSCSSSFSENKNFCPVCEGLIINLHLIIKSKKTDFSVCLDNNCRWNSLSEREISKILTS